MSDQSKTLQQDQRAATMLMQRPEIAAAHLLRLTQSPHHAQPVAAVVPAGEDGIDLSALNRDLAQALPEHPGLADLFECPALPRDTKGHVDTQSLAETLTRIRTARQARDMLHRCTDPSPLEYIARTRAYYRRLGFGAPYVWAENTHIPFAPLEKPLSKARIALVTTAARHAPDAGDQGPGAPYNAAAKFYEVYRAAVSDPPELFISHIAIDRDNTHADDPNAYFPLHALQQAAQNGQIAEVTPHFFGLPTNRSKRVTCTVDAPALLRLCQEDGADAVVFVPNCPVCHQSVTLVARVLEEAGLPTVIMGCARDIVAAAGPPRFLFNDFPLGNSAGRPHDPLSQTLVMQRALDLLEQAREPGTIRRTPLPWIGRKNWKRYYSNADLLTPAEIEDRRAAFAAGNATAKALREQTTR